MGRPQRWMEIQKRRNSPLKHQSSALDQLSHIPTSPMSIPTLTRDSFCSRWMVPTLALMAKPLAEGKRKFSGISEFPI